MLKKDMKLELALIDFYMSYTSKINDPAIRATLFKLIEESTFHYLRFRQLYLKKGFKMALPPTDLHDLEIADLLQEGMKEEHGARVAYETQLALTNDKEVINIFFATAQDEKRH